MANDNRETGINDERLDEKTHGAHGSGQGKDAERHVDPATPLPGNAGHKGDDHFSNAAWGNAASGGSVIDKRKPESK
jgi:hypothetical protein